MTDILTPLATHFHAAPDGLPKYARLRQAIVNAIEAGDLMAGSKMPGERELSELLGLSLGTTQKALGGLTSNGFLVRKQGHGTFVGSDRRAIAGSWHFRFLSGTDDKELPVFATIQSRELVRQPGAWAPWLGADSKGYVRIERTLDVGGKFTCLSEMYLGASRFARLLRMAEKRLADNNLKSILETEFGAPTLRAEGLARVVSLSAQECVCMAVEPGTWGMQMEIVARSFGHAPISFQRVVVPPTPHGLRLDFSPPVR